MLDFRLPDHLPPCIDANYNHQHDAARIESMSHSL
jgi:hypothetical protein